MLDPPNDRKKSVAAEINVSWGNAKIGRWREEFTDDFLVSRR
jgi:hypothetical protein